MYNVFHLAIFKAKADHYGPELGGYCSFFNIYNRY